MSHATTVSVLIMLSKCECCAAQEYFEEEARYAVLTSQPAAAAAPSPVQEKTAPPPAATIEAPTTASPPEQPPAPSPAAAQADATSSAAAPAANDPAATVVEADVVLEAPGGSTALQPSTVFRILTCHRSCIRLCTTYRATILFKTISHSGGQTACHSCAGGSCRRDVCCAHHAAP